MRRLLLLSAIVLALPAAAQSARPGLWEVTSRMNNPKMDQAMAQMQQQLAAMPPEQRRQMEDVMARQGVRLAPAAGGGVAAQVCMTDEMAQRNDVPMQQGCKVTSQQRSGNTTTMAFACSDPPSTGEGQFTFSGPQAYTSRMTVRTTVAGKPETMTVEGSGKWLKADCGGIKPIAPPKQ